VIAFDHRTAALLREDRSGADLVSRARVTTARFLEGKGIDG
jgi:hypothetical protein